MPANLLLQWHPWSVELKATAQKRPLSTNELIHISGKRVKVAEYLARTEYAVEQEELQVDQLVPREMDPDVELEDLELSMRDINQPDQLSPSHNAAPEISYVVPL